MVDHIKSARLVKTLKSLTKCSVISYMILFLTKIVLYFEVHSAIKVIDTEHKDKGLGSFMAEYVENTTGSVILSSVLLSLFFIYYLTNFCIIKLMTKMLDFINSQDEEYLIS